MMETEPERVRQVIVNLIFNAAEMLSPYQWKRIFLTRINENAALIEVEDTGSGISRENLARSLIHFLPQGNREKGPVWAWQSAWTLRNQWGGTINIDSAGRKGDGRVGTDSLPRRVGICRANGRFPILWAQGLETQSISLYHRNCG